MNTTSHRAELFFACQKPGIHAASPTASAGWHVTAAGVAFSIDCPAGSTPEPGALRAVGDPDLYIRGDQVRVQLAWGATTAEKLYVQVSCDGARCGEFGDRRIIVDEQWSVTVAMEQQGWRADVMLPWELLPEGSQERWQELRVGLIWCSANLGMMSWPTPFVTWNGWRLHLASLALGAPTMLPNELTSRAEQLLASLPERLGSYPDDAPDGRSRFAALLRKAYDREDLAAAVHRRASSNPMRTFLLIDGDPEDSRDDNLERNLTMLDQFDATGTAERLGRGEMLVNLAAIYHRDGDEALSQRLQQSIRRWLEHHPITRGLQPRVPAGEAGSSLAFRDVWASHINGSYTLGLIMRALFTLSMRKPIDSQLLELAFKRGLEAYRFGVEHIASHYHWNHSINWLNKMIEIATLSLEMSDSTQRVEACWNCMQQALETMILPDGLSQELCSMYCFVVFYRLMEAIDACDDAGVAVPASIRAWAIRLLESRCLGYLLPNGLDAGFSDSHGIPTDGFHPPPSRHDGYLRRVCGKLGRPDLLFMSTGGRHGERPEVLDHAARFAGIYAARTGWTRDDCALILDAGPLGRAHAHDDRLNFVYSYKTRVLLIDHTYPAGRTPNEFNSRGVSAHSTVTVDGFQSDYLPDFFKRVNRQEQSLRFERRYDLHYLEATHQLEEISGERHITVHRRIITQLTRFIWIVDRLEGQGSCISRSRFVLPAGAIDVSGSRFVTQSGVIDLGGMSLDGQRAEAHSPAWPPEAVGRHVVEFGGDAHDLPATRSYLLFPIEGGTCPWPEVEIAPGDEPARLTVRWPDGRVDRLQW